MVAVQGAQDEVLLARLTAFTGSRFRGNGRELREKRLAGSLGKEGVLEASAVDDQEVVERKSHLQCGEIFFYESGVEHGGIVGGESDRDAVAEEFRKWVSREIGVGRVELDVKSVGAEIASRADFERNLAICERVHERGTADGGNAVTDAFGVEEIKRVFDLIGAACFAGMNDQVEALFGGIRKRGTKIGKRK